MHCKRRVSRSIDTIDAVQSTAVQENEILVRSTQTDTNRALRDVTRYLWSVCSIKAGGIPFRFPCHTLFPNDVVEHFRCWPNLLDLLFHRFSGRLTAQRGAGIEQRRELVSDNDLETMYQ
jgi:hypothetical protein